MQAVAYLLDDLLRFSQLGVVLLLLLQTLDKVLQAVQAAQAAQNQAGQMMQQTAAAGATVQESALISRCGGEGGCGCCCSSKLHDGGSQCSEQNTAHTKGRR
jgi:hypothetical protein